MKATVLRTAGAIAAGIAITMVLVVAVEFFSSIVHPFPEDFDGSLEEMAEHVERYPHWVLAVVVVAWGFTALAATWTAGRLGNRGSAAFIGVLLLAAVVFNIAQLPYPLWFTITCPIVILLAAAAGWWWSDRRLAALRRTSDQ